jgi:hypothetical protein
LFLSGRQELFVPHGLNGLNGLTTATTATNNNNNNNTTKTTTTTNANNNTNNTNTTTPPSSWSGLLDDSLRSVRLQVVSEIAVCK